MQKQDFQTYQKCFQDFEILLKFETHVFRGTIHHPLRGWVERNKKKEYWGQCERH